METLESTSYENLESADSLFKPQLNDLQQAVEGEIDFKEKSELYGGKPKVGIDGKHRLLTKDDF